MSATRRHARRTASRPIAGVCAVAILSISGCAGPSDPAPRPRPRLTGPPQSAGAADPSRTPWHGWDAIDQAVAAGAIEHLVVATPIESIGVRFRTYRLLGPRDQPGELLAERTDTGLALTIRLGRFGMPDLEADVLAEIREQLDAAR